MALNTNQSINQYKNGVKHQSINQYKNSYIYFPQQVTILWYDDDALLDLFIVKSLKQHSICRHVAPRYPEYDQPVFSRMSECCIFSWEAAHF